MQFDLRASLRCTAIALRCVALPACVTNSYRPDSAKDRKVALLQNAKTKLLMSSVLGLILAATVQAATVPNLESVPGAIAHKDGEQVFDEQMRGVLPTREFGVLPPGLDEATFIQWLAPDEDPSLLTLTGAKAWGKGGTYIGVACFAHTARDADNAREYKDTDCSEDFSLRRAKNLYLGVFEWQGQTMQPIARTEKPLDVPVPWGNSNLIPPASADADNGGASFPQSYKKLDLAAYRIAPDVTAFGLRALFNESYSGGGAFFEALQLFIVKDGRIVNILSEPMYFFQDIAGEWNKDGTRQHEISEGKNILRLLSSRTNGYYDLQIKSVDDKWSRQFVWSARLERYVVRTQPNRKK